MEQSTADQTREEVGTHLMFENERIRVWDLALAPGEWLDKHIHREDFFFIVINGGDLKHVDPQHPENDRSLRYDDGLVVFHEVAGEGKVHNRLVNVGNSPYRNLVIELKKPSSDQNTPFPEF